MPEQQAVEAVAILADTLQDTDGEPAVTPAEELPKSVDEVPPPRRRNYRLLAALATFIAVVGIIASVIVFNQWGDDAIPISEIEGEEVEESLIIEPGTLQPLQP